MLSRFYPSRLYEKKAAFSEFTIKMLEYRIIYQNHHDDEPINLHLNKSDPHRQSDKHMCRINSRDDFSFKKLFGREENKDLPISLINDIISEQEQVVEVELKKPTT